MPKPSPAFSRYWFETPLEGGETSAWLCLACQDDLPEGAEHLEDSKHRDEPDLTCHLCGHVEEEDEEEAVEV